MAKQDAKPKNNEELPETNGKETSTEKTEEVEVKTVSYLNSTGGKREIHVGGKHITVLNNHVINVPAEEEAELLPQLTGTWFKQ